MQNAVAWAGEGEDCGLVVQEGGLLGCREGFSSGEELESVRFCR